MAYALFLMLVKLRKSSNAVNHSTCGPGATSKKGQGLTYSPSKTQSLKIAKISKPKPKLLTNSGGFGNIAADILWSMRI